MNSRDTIRDMERLLPWERAVREIYVDNVKIAYHGLFEYEKFRTFLREWARKHHYIYDELSESEHVEEGGKELHMKYIFNKKLAEYYFSLLKMEAAFEHVVEKTLKVSGRSVTMQHGEVEIKLHGFLASFTQYRWESKPWFYFLRTVINKFVYRFDRGTYQGIVINDGHDLVNEVKAFFRLYEHVANKEQEEAPAEEEKEEQGEEERKQELP